MRALADSFDARRDELEGHAGAGRRAALAPTGEMAQARLPDGAGAYKANVEEASGRDPVLSNAPAMSEESQTEMEDRVRADWMSEASKVLRRQKASERTGIPDSFMFRRKEQPHGTGR